MPIRYVVMDPHTRQLLLDGIAAVVLALTSEKNENVLVMEIDDEGDDPTVR